MSDGRAAIRPLAIGLIRRGDAVLVQHGIDPVSGGAFFRPPGGGIEHGERAVDALCREFREELGAELVEPQLLTVIENIFEYGGDAYHEIVFVFAARFADDALYGHAEFVIEETTTRMHASWKSVHDFTDETPLYPPELRRLLSGSRR